MTIDSSNVKWLAERPSIPAVGPVAVHPNPCLADHRRVVDRLADTFGIKVVASVDVPFGYIAGGPNGQVEVFTASGGVRARNTDQLGRYEDERRPWRDVEKTDTADGVSYTLGDRTATRLTTIARGLVEELGLKVDPVSVGVSLGQWAMADEEGHELDSGPGRATVQFGYDVEGIPLFGPGAKTNLHFDPDERGTDGVPARFFHVHRGFENLAEVRLLGLEESLVPLLTQTWSGIEPDPKRASLTITAAEYGLLALPAHLPQRAALPALRLEGSVAGLREGAEVRFGQYLPLADPAAVQA
ncbi:MAG: hypothetical protein KDB60_02320, partial [Propionibacteriaceae bacterium]|nr:hypothetical protein [Propionibacteriaceae bacterium]